MVQDGATESPPSTTSSKYKKIFSLDILKHPFVVACFTAIAGAVVAGGFTLWSAYIQKSGSNDTPKTHAPPKSAGVDREEDVHIARIQFGEHEDYFYSDAAYQKGQGYEARLEACVPLKENTQALCVVTVKPSSTITITNSENYSEAVRVEGEKALTCCLFFNDGKNGFHIIQEKSNGAAVIGRRTVAPPAKMTVIVAVPDLDKGKSLDSLVFAIGGGDPGIKFPVAVEPLIRAPNPANVRPPREVSAQ